MPAKTRTAAALAALALLTAHAGAAEGPLVVTDKGPVMGAALPGTPAVVAFLGVPYAAPPVASLRLRPPQPHTAWVDPVMATQVAPFCPQFTQTAQMIGDEDCLYLNVYAPGEQGGKRPVMVFLPGGGFALGSASSPYYKSEAVVRQAGVVVVTVTYRVGPLGFLAAAALDAESPQHVSGNYGLLDQQEALRWVQRNIAAFGGDPANVTLFGESAGANSIEKQLTAPGAAGLFARAIIESAVGKPGIPDLPLAEAEAGSSANVVAKVGCAGKDDVAACLRAVPTAAFLTPGLGTPTTTYPVMDGVLFPVTPLEAFERGQFNRVPVIIGTNHDEVTTLMPPPLRQALQAEGGYGAVLARNFGPVAAKVAAAYPLASYPSAMQAFAALSTDGMVACQTEAKRQALARWVPVWGYEFSKADGAVGPIHPPGAPGLTYGAYHTAELPYVFGVASPDGVALTGADAVLSHAVIGAWTAFAVAGEPGAVWPRYESGNLLRIDAGLDVMPVVQFVSEHRCGFWGDLGG